MSHKDNAGLIHCLASHGAHRNPATLSPNSRPNRERQCRWGQKDSNNRMAMTEKQDRLAREREEIAARVASFKATQEKFERERQEYYATTLANAWDRFAPRSR
jgi:hypothetical protein